MNMKIRVLICFFRVTKVMFVVPILHFRVQFSTLNSCSKTKKNVLKFKDEKLKIEFHAKFRVIFYYFF
jgi:hypothetical protein